VYFLKNAGLLVDEDPTLIIAYMNGIFYEEMNDMQNG
jgi:hypothetical protein